MKRKVAGHFYGHKKFAVDKEWLAIQEEKRQLKRRQKFEEWSRKWITITRLKSDRLWTDWAIKTWLGAPKKQGDYRVFEVPDVKAAERKKAFKEWHQPRLEKKVSVNPDFKIIKLK